MKRKGRKLLLSSYYYGHAFYDFSKGTLAVFNEDGKRKGSTGYPNYTFALEE